MRHKNEHNQRVRGLVDQLRCKQRWHYHRVNGCAPELALCTARAAVIAFDWEPARLDRYRYFSD